MIVADILHSSETLRLHPPVPTNGPRQVMRGTGSKVIAGWYAAPSLLPL